MSPVRFFAPAILAAALCVSCNTADPHRAIDPATAACVPDSATILAGAHLDRIRASPLTHNLPSAAQSFFDSLRSASSVVVASDGADFLFVSRGSFTSPPAGAVLIGKGLAVSGSPAWVERARTHHSADSGPPIVELAEPIAAANEMWMVTQGSANLPVTGNGENLNRLLHATQYTLWTVRLADRVDFAIQAVCANAETARRLEETTRAMFTFGAAAAAKQPQLSGLLKKVQVRRDDRTVHVTAALDSAEFARLLQGF